MSSRKIAIALLIMSLAVLAAFFYLRHDARKAHETTQTPAPPPPKLEPQAPVPEQEPPARVHAPLEVKKAKPSIDPKDSAHAPSVPLHPNATAWEKVEYIRNNLHLYGTFHPDADAIIAQLNPPPESFLNAKAGFTESGEFVHDEAGHELVFDLFAQLIPLNDPRAAELIVRYRYEYGAASGAWSRALVDLGAPSIPFLLEHVKMQDSASRLSVVERLKELVDRHPDLDPDIVTDILEPLFEKDKRWLRERGLL